MKAFLSQRFVPVGLLIMTAISTTISPPAAAAVTSSGDDAPIDFADRTVIQSCDDLDGLQVKNLILVRGGLICEGAKKKVSAHETRNVQSPRPLAPESCR